MPFLYKISCAILNLKLNFLYIESFVQNSLKLDS